MTKKLFQKDWYRNLRIFVKSPASLVSKGLEVLDRTSLNVDIPSKLTDERNLRPYSTLLGLAAIAKLESWKPVSKKKKDGRIAVIDLFSGCGGMTLGFEAVSLVAPSFVSIGALDINESANHTYKSNFGVTPATQDINIIANSRHKAKEYLKKCGYESGNPLILIGCAPCQGFTSHRKKQWHIKDARNTLIESFALVARNMNPDVVVMENVPEMLSRKYWNHFSSACSILISAGYNVRQVIYNCATFGAPQARFRALVIGMKQKFSMPEGFLVPDRFLTVREAIGKLPSLKPGCISANDPLHMAAKHREETIEIIKQIPKNGGSRPFGVGPKCLDRVNGYYDVYGRLSWDKPAITITHYSRNPASGRYVHPQQDRGLSIREAANLQSFPKGFIFEGSFDEKFSQIGNAVPPRFSCFVAANILCELGSSIEPRQYEMGPKDITSPVTNSYSSVIASLKLCRKESNERICANSY